MAIFGVIFFAAVLLLVAAAHFGPAVRDNIPGYTFAMSTGGLAVCLYLAYVSFFVLKSVCVLCLATYAAVIGLLVVSGAAITLPMTTLPKRAVQDIRRWVASPLAITITVLFFGGAVLMAALMPRDGSAGGATAVASAAAPASSQDQSSEFERWFASQPRVPLVIPKEGAKVLVVKFNDYQCPPCRQSYVAYKPILEKYETEQPGAVRMVYKDFPLDAECNRLMQNGGLHQAACEAAAAVRLAAFRKRESLIEWLFTNQPTLTPDLVRQAARDIGGVSDFDARYASTLDLVKSDIELGQQLGVKATPTFFIDGVKIEGPLPPQFFDQAIAYELQHNEAAGR